MDNLEIYKKVKDVPKEAKKEIQAGRLKGKTDINPMWRIKVLTETFGICGFGWRYEIIEQRLEKGANEEISAFVTIKLYIKHNGEWSAAIPGTGGSSYVAKEQRGLYTNDECFKMALTDAISVACKAIGVGASVYWDKDTSKYDTQQQSKVEPKPLMIQLNEKLKLAKWNSPKALSGIKEKYKVSNLQDMTDEQMQELIKLCEEHIKTKGE